MIGLENLLEFRRKLDLSHQTGWLSIFPNKLNLIQCGFGSTKSELGFGLVQVFSHISTTMTFKLLDLARYGNQTKLIKNHYYKFDDDLASGNLVDRMIKL